MQALTVYRLSAAPRHLRRYLDGKQVTATAWHNAHWQRDTDTFQTTTTTRADGVVMVRQFHCIRINRNS